MKDSKKFWLLFVILEKCYFSCLDDDLGGLLGALSPDLWGDGYPADMAILRDWEEGDSNNSEEKDGFVNRIVSFLRSYSNSYGFDFNKAIEWLQKMTLSDYQEYQRVAEQKEKEWRSRLSD